AHELVLLRVQVALRLVEQAQELPLLARDARQGQRRSLPEIVVVDLRDGRAEPVLELRLGRGDVLPLSLERTRFREMQLDAEDADIARAHARYRKRCVRGW